MATFPDDFVRLNLTMGIVCVTLKKVGLKWPPPERIVLDLGGVLREPEPDDPPTIIMRRVSYSQITDEQLAGMPHVARGAEYVYEVPPVGMSDTVTVTFRKEVRDRVANAVWLQAAASMGDDDE